MHDGSRKAIAAAFLANLGIAIAKFVGFAITRSASLLAEGIHSGADTANQGLLFLGGARAKKRADAVHQFGYGRERYFWAFVVALVLFSMGGLFAIYEGIEKLRHPHEPENLAVAVTILGIAIALETWSFRTAMKESKPLKGPSSWWQFVRRSKSPELPVVLLEDLGALTGLALALTGVLLAAATGNGRWDAAGSLAIGVLLVVIAVVLAWEMKGLLIGEAAAPEVQDGIKAGIEASPAVRRLIHLRTEHLGPDHLLVAAKVEFDHHLTTPQLADAIDGAEAAVRAAAPVGAHLTIYLEPDLHEPARDA